MNNIGSSEGVDRFGAETPVAKPVTEEPVGDAVKYLKFVSKELKPDERIDFAAIRHAGEALQPVVKLGNGEFLKGVANEIRNRSESI